MIRKACVLLAIILSPILSYGQLTSRSSRIASSQIEQLLEDAMAEGREAFLIDALSHLRENPMDINMASVDELCQLPVLDVALARRIVDYRSRTSFATVNELLQVEGIDDVLLSVWEPFITVRPTSASAPSISSEVKARTRLSRSLSDQAAAKSSGYLGSAEKAYNKVTANVATSPTGMRERGKGERSGFLMRLGFLTEKDPGEPDYADFISAYACVDLPTSGIRFILGDFGVDAANGEVFSSSGSFAGSAATVHYGGLMRESVRPSLASESSGNCRGAAVSWLNNPIAVSIFASARPRDATVDSNGAVKSLSTDGYHRTDRELSRWRQVRETIVGTRARFRLAEGLDCGLSWYSSKLDRDVLEPEGLGVQGSRAYAIGLDIAFVQGANAFSAEVARRLEGIHSCVLSYRWSPDKILATSLLVRMSGGQRVESAAIGIGGTARDLIGSSGAAWSIRFRPSSWMRISASYDQYLLPRRASTNALPASGHDMQLNVECNPVKSTTLELRYRQKFKPVHETAGVHGGLEQTVDGGVKQTQLRASLATNLSNWIRSRSRIELSEVGRQFERGINRGLLMYHECAFTLMQTLSVALRGIAFETGSYESRIYEFEEDVEGAFQNPALYGRGFRWYVRSELQCGSWLTCSVKYAHTEMRSIDPPEMRTANSQLRHDERWSIQLDVRW